MKLFSLDMRKGTFIDDVSKQKGTVALTGTSKFKKTEKGLALYDKSNVSTSGLIYTGIPDFSVGTIVTAFKSDEITNSNNLFCITNNAGNRFQVYKNAGGKKIRVFADGYWQETGIEHDTNLNLLIATYDGTTRKLYLNNQEVTMGSSTAVTTATSNQCWVGDGPTTHGLNGFLNFRTEFHNEVLSQSEMDKIYVEFLNSYGTTEQKRNFIYPKATDLSNEVDSVIGDDIVTNGSFDTDITSWTDKASAISWVSDSPFGNTGAIQMDNTLAGGSNAAAGFYQNIGAKPLTKYQITAKAKITRGSTQDLRVFTSTSTGGAQGDVQILHASATLNEEVIINYTFTTDATLLKSSFQFAGDSDEVTIIWDDITVQEVSGLQTAYNMIPSKGTLVDISGNGNDGTIDGALTSKDGMSFDGVSNKVTTGETAEGSDNLGSVQCRFKANANVRTAICGGFIDNSSIYLATTGQIGSGTTAVGTATTTSGYGDGKIHTLTVVKNAANDYTFYVDGVDVSGGDNSGYRASITKNIGCAEATSTTYTLFWDGEIYDFKAYDYQLTPTQAQDYHNSFNKPTLINTFKDEGADGIVKTPRDFIKGTGSYKVEENSEGKYLECDTTAGTIATQSKQATGRWQWKMNATGTPVIFPILSKNTIVDSDGYRMVFNIASGLFFRRYDSGVSTTLFNTVTNYLDINTDYEITVDRLSSEGVFKDIPTMQTSGMENGSVVPYPTFTSTGRYGYHAINTVADGTHLAGTNEELDIILSAKYLIEFDLKLNSGSLPTMRFSSSHGSGTKSDVLDAVEGRNSHIHTVTGTSANAVYDFYTTDETDYEISGFTIRKIYDPYTFAVFIEGGSFTERTLVVPSSGSNPVTDSTYKTSEYFVADLDDGDRISDIKLKNGVEQ